MDTSNAPPNGLGQPVIGWAARQRMQVAWDAMVADSTKATRTAYSVASLDYHHACAIERAAAQPVATPRLDGANGYR